MKNEKKNYLLKIDKSCSDVLFSSTHCIHFGYLLWLILKETKLFDILKKSENEIMYSTFSCCVTKSQMHYISNK